MDKLRRYIFKMSVLRLSIMLTLLFLLVFIVKEERGLSFGLFDIIELKALDLKFIDRGPRPANGQVVIVAIDEKSINKLGLWPWNRVMVAIMLSEINKAGARLVAFDVVFADEDRTKLSKVLKTVQDEIDAIEVENCRDCEKLRDEVLDFLDDEIENSDPDKLLAQAIGMNEKTVLGFFNYTDPREISHLDPETLAEDLGRINPSKIKLIKPLDPKRESEYINAWPRGLAARVPLKLFTDSTDYFGHFSIQQDRDGTVRWADLVQQIDIPGIEDETRLYPSLSLQAAAAYLDREIVVHTYPMGVYKISLGLGDDIINIPINNSGQLLVNYHGPGRTFPTVSAVDVIEGRIPPETFKDKLVLVGVTATAVFDLRVTPFQKDFPGVEVHANVIDNILNRDYLLRPWWAFYLELSAILVFGLLFGLMLKRVSALWGAIMVMLVITGYYLVDKFYFFPNGYWVYSALPSAQAFIIFLACYVYRYMTEEREKRKLKGAFKQYVSESIVDHLMDNVEQLKLGGQKKELTVLFSDIRGFTTVSEKLPPEELGNFINEYLNPMTEIVLKYDGVLDKYVGDEVMAFWGAPLEQPDHAQRACETGLDMLSELALLNQHWAERGKPVIDIGIGVNTGTMWVGNMGSNLRFDYSLLGDNVNLGARLEGTNKQYGTHMIISEFTQAAVADLFVFRKLDLIRVKGKTRPVVIFELLERRPGTPEKIELATRFEQGLDLYSNRRWNEALEVFESVRRDFNDDAPSRVFIERCRAYLENPPPDDWDGAYTMTTK